MHILQRTILTWAVILVLLCGPLFIYKGRAENVITQWEVIKTEQFMEKAVRTGKITEDELSRYIKSLNYTGVRSEIRLEKYQKEEDLTGENYFRLIIAEDMQEEIENFEWIYFERGSIIVVNVYRTFGKSKTQNTYVKTVFGR